MTSELLCLTFAIYLESGGEDLKGKIAVANVISNRVISKRYPETFCGVIKQKHQFEFFWNGIPETKPTYNRLEIEAWKESEALAQAMLAEGGNGEHFLDLTDGALHYAVIGVSREWMKNTEVIQIGNHAFYIGVK